MAKRFTDNGKWSKSWFMDLPTDHKLLWIYMLDACDHAGVWEVNWKLTSFMTGLPVTSLPKTFGKQVTRIDDKRYFIRDFVAFQYGSLNEKVNAHRSVINILQRFGIDISTLKQPLKKGSSRVKDKDKDKDLVKDKAKKKDKSLKSITLEVRREWQKDKDFQTVNVEKEFKRFSNWLASKGKVYKDYHATFRNWLMSKYVEHEDMTHKEQEKDRHVVRRCPPCDMSYQVPLASADKAKCRECGVKLEKI